MEAQYRKFLDMMRAIRINVPLVDVLAGMPNYEKFLKELISNKHKIKQIFVAFLSDESSAIIQNKVPPKLGDTGSFLIPCNFNRTFSCNALADLGASINLILYSLHAKLSLETLKPTKMSVRLADISFQYPVGIAKNMLVEVGKFTFPSDFVILEMEKDSKFMRTRNFYFPNNSSVTILRRRNKRRTPNIVEPEIRTIVEVAPMVDNRTMEELLQAPKEGYGEAIVILEINANHFEIKTNLLQLGQANPYHGFERENPHTHINNFKKITSTLKFRDVPNDVIKLMMFPYSLGGSASVLYDKEPPNSILTWEDLVNKFVNQFFPPSKTTHLKNEISHFTQRFKETFGEAWERFKEMLRACPTIDL
uniref:Reverse transcriptase domain-containing protein n=1 Tax=Tanacetum cinerariifolium TaxID=118510 RepID=A0A6L2NR20_TANCI|nr:reverse transcriptase domain-containing protein [Tanacetum cinerariifolium]